MGCELGEKEMKKVLMTKHDWNKLDRLACPNLRTSGYLWYALKKDPCLKCDGTGDTGYKSCHNSRKSFHESDRLRIVELIDK
jgi:hypothetical protein